MNKKLKKYGRAISYSVGLASLVCDFIASGFTVDTVSAFIGDLHETAGSLADYWTVFTVFYATVPIVLAALASALLLYYAKLGGQWKAWVIAGIWLVAIWASAAVVHPTGLAAAQRAGSAASPASTLSPLPGCSVVTPSPHVIELPVGRPPAETASPLIKLPVVTGSHDITLPAVDEPSPGKCTFGTGAPSVATPSPLSHGLPGLLLSIFIFEFKWIFTAYGKVLAAQGISIGVIGAFSIVYFPQKWERDERKEEEEKKKEQEGQGKGGSQKGEASGGSQ